LYHTLTELTLVLLLVVYEFLLAKPMLLAVFPLTFVSLVFCDQDAETVVLIVLKLAFIVVAITPSEFALSTSFALQKLTFVFRSIHPSISAVSLIFLVDVIPLAFKLIPRLITFLVLDYFPLTKDILTILLFYPPLDMLPPVQQPFQLILVTANFTIDYPINLLINFSLLIY